MNILQITHKLPFPPLDGGSIVIHSHSQGLIDAGHKVKVLSMVSPKRGMKSAEIDPGYRDLVQLETVEVDTRLKWKTALVNLFTQKPYHISRFISRDFAEQLKSVLRAYRYDVIQLESIFVLPYLDICKQYGKAPVLLRTQNVEFIIWEGLTKHCRNPIKKAYLWLQTRRLKRFEIKHLSAVDGIIPISTFDEELIEAYIPQLPPIRSIPFGMNFCQSTPIEAITDQASSQLFHLASMDWRPNLQAVDWFLEEVWPQLQAILPQLTVHLAGKFMPERLLARHNTRLRMTGIVHDPIAFMRGKQLMIVPLLSGSGLRVKILEGMALGKTVISTSLGAKGIDCTHEENILIADTPEEMIQCICNCVLNPDYSQQIGQAARDFVYQYYDLKEVTRQFLNFYSSVAGLARQKSRMEVGPGTVRVEGDRPLR